MKIKDGYILRDVAGVSFAVPVGSESVGNNKMITVNETGKFMWKILEKDVTREELLNKMLSEYDVDADVLNKDIDEFLNILRGDNLLEE
ncbi:MAG: PqqD family protein [Clostridia bacterium]|nr:PqqD family protein [Clostridia bacterium]